MRGPDTIVTSRARRLGVAQTDAETKLWQRLRNRQIGSHKFVRQAPVGRYVCDFVCREMRLVVEVDGGQHANSQHDRIRDAFLSASGYRVLRFWNNDVLNNIEGVLLKIQETLETISCPSPGLLRSPTSPRQRGEVKSRPRSLSS